MPDAVESFPNQSSLCATCAFGFRHVYVDLDEVIQEKKLVFLCHSPIVRGEGNPRPASISDLVVECQSYRASQILVTP